MTESAHSTPVARWRYMIIGTVIVIVTFGIGAIRESYRGWQADEEIRALESQANNLEGRNARLRDLADALQSPDRLDLEARQRLGMRKPGESVVILEGFSASGTWQDQMKLDVVAEKPEIVRSNPEQWVRYFFHLKS